MKKILNQLAGVLICIFFAIFLLYIKDQMSYILGALGSFLDILTPFIYGFGIAYIMNFPYRFIKTKFFGKMKGNKIAKLSKPLSIISAYVIVLGIIYSLISFIVPALSENISVLFENLSGYVDTFGTNINNFVSWANDNLHIQLSNVNSVYNYLISFLNVDNIKNAGETIMPVITNTALVVYNWIMGIIISIYFLSSKEFLCGQIKKLAVAFLPTKWLPSIYRIINVADNKCGKFLVGKVLDSAIIGGLCLVAMSVLQIPYAALISVVVGATNIIPFFGPFIGAIPSALLLLFVSPFESLKFIILIIVIQQLDGNVIGPKVVGSQVGLSSFWSLFSVVVAGGLFGVTGMILGTPIFATIYTLLSDKVSERIEMKGENAEVVINMPVVNSENLTNLKAKKIKKKIEENNKKNASKPKNKK